MRLRRHPPLFAALTLALTPGVADAAPAAPVLSAQALNSAVALCVKPDPNATRYTIVRGGVVRATGVTAFPYTDSGRVNGTPYTYLVRAVDAAGATSPDSNSVTATPAATAPTTASPCAAAETGPSWVGDFETNNLHQFMQYFQLNGVNEPGNRISLVTSPVLQGTRAVRFELRPGDAMTMVKDTVDGSDYAPADNTARTGFRARRQADGKQYFTKGDDTYQRLAFYIDPSTTIGANITNPWRVLASFAPSVDDGRFSPLKLALHSEANGGAQPTGTDSLALAGDLGVSGAEDLSQWVLQNPVKGRWYEFIVHVKYSDAATEGLFEFWLKKPGDTTFTRGTFNRGTNNGKQTAYMKTLSGATHRANQRWGIYRNPNFPTTDVIYFDRLAWGPTAASVGLSLSSP